MNVEVKQSMTDPIQSRLDNSVDDPLFAVKHPEPQHGERNARNQRRDIENGSIDCLAAHFCIQHHSQPNGHSHSGRQRHGGINQCIGQRIAENIVAHQVSVVRKSDPDGIL